jgi:glycogen debranching enzyme
MAVESDGKAVPGAGSQLGWLLWAGALEGDAAAAAAERLAQPDVLTDWGLRTLSSEHPAFRPHAYHRGAVWPFDSWIGWGGLRAAGRTEDAERVRSGVLAALDRLGRAPELYAVTPAGELEGIAVANRVQAWTVGARWAFEHDWDGRARRAGD